VPALLGPPLGTGHVIPVQTMKAYTGSRGIVSLIDSGKRYRPVVSLMPRLFYPWEKKPPVPTEQEAGWTPELVRTSSRKEMNLLPLAGIESQNTQTIASHYTNYIIWAPTDILCVYNILSFLPHIQATAINLGYLPDHC
jgi:hypothetical protein